MVFPVRDQVYLWFAVLMLVCLVLCIGSAIAEKTLNHQMKTVKRVLEVSEKNHFLS